MHDYVSEILRFPQIPLIDFSFQGVTVNATSFSRVLTALGDGSITLKVDASIKADEAAYDTQQNAFLFPNEDLPTMLIDQALVVHEAVHAACDIAGTPTKTLLSETVAYLAQGMFIYYFLKPKFDADEKHWPFGPGLVKTAFDAGKRARNKCGVALTDEEVKPLLDAIKGHDKYKDDVGITVPYNGL